jgi:alpha-beta hydrolase superfamily lysophospholipase
MSTRLRKLLKFFVGLMLAALLLLFAVRVYIAQSGAPLEIWHTFAPHELNAEELDEADWQRYLQAEQAVFDEVRTHVTDHLDTDERVAANRYFEGSPLYPGHFETDWNRSFVLEPDGEPLGAVVLLHGLTDSPYSMRNVARLYQKRGFVAVAPRLPGHGTVPAGLVDVYWQDWAAATRLAVREAVQRVGPDSPLHVVGYSNGGALAMKYALDAVDDPSLRRPDHIVLISPMIGVTEMARFAGLAGLPAVFPAFAEAAWLSIVPEINPFKYNSFPVNGARQSSLLTRALQPRISKLAEDGRIGELPPILTFQSAVDFTVSTPAVIDALYSLLPSNGSELVLLDLNRSTKFGLLMRPSAETLLSDLLPEAPRRYRTTIVTNAGPETTEMVARVTEADEVAESVHPLGQSYPSGVFSLSHIALPFPIDDPLYGLTPDLSENFGVRLGAVALRGERGALVVSLDTLNRMSSNPFFSFLLERIGENITRGE